MPKAALRAALGQRDPARRYIYDRCNGTSVHQGVSRRPCCYICWVPPPVITWPNTYEQNDACECIGRTGCCGRKNHRSRSAIFTVLLLLNLYAFALTVFSSFTLSDSLSILAQVKFAEGTAFLETNKGIAEVRAYVGVDYVGVQDHGGVLGHSGGETIYTWDEFCGNFTGDNPAIEAFESLEDCQKCADASGDTARLMICTLLAALPLIATDVLRRFPNYDLNCQKTWAVLTSLGALFCSFWVWYTLDKDCFSVFLDPDGDGQGLSNAVVSVSFSWEAGSALTCMFCVSIVYAIHLLGHCVVPTPEICYTTEEQVAYEENHLALQLGQSPPRVIPDVEDVDNLASARHPSFDDDDSGIYIDETPNNFAHNRRIIEDTVKF